MSLVFLERYGYFGRIHLLGSTVSEVTNKRIQIAPARCSTLFTLLYGEEGSPFKHRVGESPHFLMLDFQTCAVSFKSQCPGPGPFQMYSNLNHPENQHVCIASWLISISSAVISGNVISRLMILPINPFNLNVLFSLKSHYSLSTTHPPNSTGPQAVTSPWLQADNLRHVAQQLWTI